MEQPEIDASTELAFGDVPRRVITLRGGEQLTVLPLVAQQFGPFKRALQPLMAALAPVFASADKPQIAPAFFGLLDHSEALIESLSVGTGQPLARIGALHADELLAVTVAVFEVNANFFVRWMQALGALPSVQTTAGPIATTP